MKEVESNHGGALKDPLGHPLPPFMVMERGESLDIWSTRSKPDRTLAFGVRLHVNFTVPAVSSSWPGSTRPGTHGDKTPCA